MPVVSRLCEGNFVPKFVRFGGDPSPDVVGIACFIEREAGAHAIYGPLERPRPGAAAAGEARSLPWTAHACEPNYFSHKYIMHKIFAHNELLL